jgi:DNA repair protein RecO (recombination protein O)
VGTRIVTAAIILRTVNYGESDRVVTLLGQVTGRVAALARGARKSGRRFAGGLGLAAGGEATLNEGRGGDLMLLEAFAVVEPRAGLAADLGRTTQAAYALELCDRLCAPRQPEPQVFDWLGEFLWWVDSHGATVERLRVFELGLCKRLGIGPTLASCASCGRADLADETTRWLPAHGGVFCSACGKASRARHGSAGALLSGETRQALARLGETSLADAGSSEPLARDTNTGCRRAMIELWRAHTGAPLRSLEFIEKMGGPS